MFPHTMQRVRSQKRRKDNIVSRRSKSAFRDDLCNLIESTQLWIRLQELHIRSFISSAISSIQYIGGTCIEAHGKRAGKFQIYLAKLIEWQLPVAAIEVLVRQPYFKYLTFLAAVAVRLTQSHRVIWQLLGPLLHDYRNLALCIPQGANVRSGENSRLSCVVSHISAHRRIVLVNVDALIFDILHINGHYRPLDVFLPFMPISVANLQLLRESDI